MGWGLLVQHAERHSQAKAADRQRGGPSTDRDRDRDGFPQGKRQSTKSPPLTVSVGGAAVFPSAWFWGDKGVCTTQRGGPVFVQSLF